MWQYNSPDELCHYGVKGMKWGVRRYQDQNGNLTKSEKKKIGKQYKKLAVKTAKRLNKQYSNMYVKAHNKTADYMNRGGIDKFNSEQRKKYGDKYAKRKTYSDEYLERFQTILAKNVNKSVDQFYRNDKNYQKGKALVNAYNMTSWHELAKSNEAKVREVRKAVEEH